MAVLADTRIDRLRARAAAYTLAARMLGDDADLLADPTGRAELRLLLARSGAARAADLLVDGDPIPDPDELRGRWVRWFDLGRIAPYEGSNVPASAGGVTPRLADIAGFYAAFGLQVDHDRPDHLVAEFEYLAVLVAAEADAHARADAARADIAASAARTFLRDHLGTWVAAWAARVADVAELAPWAPLAAAAAELVRIECHERNVIPLRHAAVLAGNAGIAGPEAAVLECGGTADSPE